MLSGLLKAGVWSVVAAASAGACFFFYAAWGPLKNVFGEQQDNTDAFYVFVAVLFALPGLALLALAAGVLVAAHVLRRSDSSEEVASERGPASE